MARLALERLNVERAHGLHEESNGASERRRIRGLGQCAWDQLAHAALVAVLQLHHALARRERWQVARNRKRQRVSLTGLVELPEH
eukprot:scaffold133687_cov31-Tisochrysis_lutea.AAC.5